MIRSKVVGELLDCRMLHILDNRTRQTFRFMGTEFDEVAVSSLIPQQHMALPIRTNIPPLVVPARLPNSVKRLDT